jgi:hypothetical protein
MRNFIRIMTLVAIAATSSGAALAATPNEFYLSLLRRGISAFDGEKYADATQHLRIAAFGLVDMLDRYQVAHAYLALAYDRVGASDRARESARRVVAAERLQRHWGAAMLPDSVRSGFEALAARLLTPADVASLRASTASAPASQQASVPPPQTTPARTTTAVTMPRSTSGPNGTSTQPNASTTTQPPASGTTTSPQATAPRTTQTVAPPPAATTDANRTAPTPARTTPAPATTVPEKTAGAPAPVRTTPAPSTTAPRQTTAHSGTTQAGTAAPERTTSAATTPQPQPAATTTNRPLSAGEVAQRLIAADRALTASNLSEARRLYREILAAPTVPRETLIRVAEGLYRARDFSGALTAFNSIGALRRGEEPYRYYIAVALYESGDYARAKKELAAVLPFIEITPDVARYRIRIEGSAN